MPDIKKWEVVYVHGIPIGIGIRLDDDIHEMLVNPVFAKNEADNDLPGIEEMLRTMAAAPALLAACKAVEWTGRASYHGSQSRCCPECGGIKPDPELRPGEKRDGYDWAEAAYGHRDWCKLKAAIEAAEPKGA